MAEILKGAPVAAALTDKMKQDVAELQEHGINPTLAILRVGERPDDLAYERGAVKRSEKAGVEVRKVVLPEDVTQEEFDRVLTELNQDASVHGILMMRPLPGHLDNERARQMLAPEKDIDGCTDGSLAGVFTNTPTGFPPCTAQAAMEMLHHYGYEVQGKKVAVIGRSLVIGRPVAMMLMHENATVVNCHTKTVDVPSITREADITGLVQYLSLEDPAAVWADRALEAAKSPRRDTRPDFVKNRYDIESVVQEFVALCSGTMESEKTYENIR
jgi:methylenetetrahydrofolate dehydrogenase (NADP+)/methenyltetrahydrofolate cyclohydrolase